MTRIQHPLIDDWQIDLPNKTVANRWAKAGWVILGDEPEPEPQPDPEPEPEPEPDSEDS